jgi:predicted dienelactone hydrolase
MKVSSNAVSARLFALILMLYAVWPAAQNSSYNPLAVPIQFKAETLDLTVHDEARGRDIPILIYLPAEKTPAPVVLFSHGLGGSRQGSAYLGEHWAARGYVAVFVQHPGSDESVLKDIHPAGRIVAMKNAANLRNTLLRLKDVSAVLDQIERWNKSSSNQLAGRLDMSRVGMSGHSFGAVTTQWVSGQRPCRGNLDFTDGRIKAAIMFSPSSPKGECDPRTAFGGVKIPWMVMTGTKDEAPIGGATVASRLAVFDSLPPGRKYEVVLYDAEHSAFTDRALPGDREPRNPNHHKVILALSTAFWDAYLRDDGGAKAWLDGAGPASLLEPKDQWQKK